MNIISLDIGMKRTGICLYLENILLPQKTVETAFLDSSLQSIIKENDYEIVIVGVPLDKEMRETEMSGRIREIAKNLKSISSLKIEFFNEHLTTKEAERLAKSDIKKNKQKSAVDSLSAMIILEEYLNEKEK
jgi:putative Holliday junction resolvase